MNTISDFIPMIRRAVQEFTSFTALLVLTRAPEDESIRLEIHLLDVPPDRSFRTMDAMVQHLMGQFGELPWLVFAHSATASRAVAQRLQGRAETVMPLHGWHAQFAMLAAEALEDWRSVELRPVAWASDLDQQPTISSPRGEFLVTYDVDAAFADAWRSDVSFGRLQRAASVSVNRLLVHWLTDFGHQTESAAFISAPGSEQERCFPRPERSGVAA